MGSVAVSCSREAAGGGRDSTLPDGRSGTSRTGPAFSLLRRRGTGGAYRRDYEQTINVKGGKAMDEKTRAMAMEMARVLLHSNSYLSDVTGNLLKIYYKIGCEEKHILPGDLSEHRTGEQKDFPINKLVRDLKRIGKEKGDQGTK